MLRYSDSEGTGLLGNAEAQGRGQEQSGHGRCLALACFMAGRGVVQGCSVWQGRGKGMLRVGEETVDACMYETLLQEGAKAKDGGGILSLLKIELMHQHICQRTMQPAITLHAHTKAWQAMVNTLLIQLVQHMLMHPCAAHAPCGWSLPTIEPPQLSPQGFHRCGDTWRRPDGISDPAMVPDVTRHLRAWHADVL